MRPPISQMLALARRAVSLVSFGAALIGCAYSLRDFHFQDLFQAKLAIILANNPVALAGGGFKFLAVHDLHCATGVLDEFLLL